MSHESQYLFGKSVLGDVLQQVTAGLWLHILYGDLTAFQYTVMKIMGVLLYTICGI